MKHLEIVTENEGATADQIDSLVQFAGPIPAAMKSLWQKHNGLRAELKGCEAMLDLYSLDDIISYTQEFEVRDLVPEATVIGSDGTTSGLYFIYVADEVRFFFCDVMDLESRHNWIDLGDSLELFLFNVREVGRAEDSGREPRLRHGDGTPLNEPVIEPPNDLAKKSLVGEVRLRGVPVMRGLAFAPDGKSILFFCRGDQVVDLETLKCKRERKWVEGRIGYLDRTPYPYLTTGTDGGFNEIQFWDILAKKAVFGVRGEDDDWLFHGDCTSDRALFGTCRFQRSDPNVHNHEAERALPSTVRIHSPATDEDSVLCCESGVIHRYVRFSCDGSLLAVLKQARKDLPAETSCDVWDMSSKSQLSSYPLGNLSIPIYERVLEFKEDNRFLACWTTMRGTVWNLETDACIFRGSIRNPALGTPARR